VQSNRDILIRLGRRLGGNNSPIIYLQSLSSQLGNSVGEILVVNSTFGADVYSRNGIRFNSSPTKFISLVSQNSTGTRIACLTYVLA